MPKTTALKRRPPHNFEREGFVRAMRILVAASRPEEAQGITCPIAWGLPRLKHNAANGFAETFLSTPSCE
jgi:hypothetical protein